MNQNRILSVKSIVAIVPAAGVGSRMKTSIPKQYLMLSGKTVLEYSVEKLLSHPLINKIVIAIADFDPYYPELSLSSNPDVIKVSGGKDRANSVLSALKYVKEHRLSKWVIVHDVVRPCIQLSDINKLIKKALNHDVGAILSIPVRDTIKYADKQKNVRYTLDRSSLWHALTPQMFKTEILFHALDKALSLGLKITDESSALENLEKRPALVIGRADNIKITQREDLYLANFFLFYKKTI
ncbi:2-C-methyl-D-erythritol 4-phosphate cytidylyltransferase [Candidatus Photodesmus katoptron]|uniref:2-C-methyl-D-erythritol 4-phosphate cytidylyltransferase n=1 Tax=Candidatus Photodesmus anomalopis TaxID=28176 RepID=UPI0005545C22|nr:2-C-methyl-D-erythritol 4-phosphate cytidylyltransferase [Candidatus Photodesmus katoptron]